jgi:hypothetical protein
MRGCKLAAASRLGDPTTSEAAGQSCSARAGQRAGSATAGRRWRAGKSVLGEVGLEDGPELLDAVAGIEVAAEALRRVKVGERGEEGREGGRAEK